MPTGATDTYVLTTDANGVGTWQAAAGGGGQVDSVVAGTNVTIDNTDPVNPIINATGGGGGGTVQNVNLSIEPTDEGTTAGNARGSSAVDLQSSRTLAAQVAASSYSTIGGGSENSISAYASEATISGGYNNTVSDAYSGCTIGGGRKNTVSYFDSTISGGYMNTASGAYSAVGGGKGNTASGYHSTISGGYGNTASGYQSSASGYKNTASGGGSTVSGGYLGWGNTASGYLSTISGGGGNTASGYGSAVLGGRFNTTNLQDSAMIVGQNITADRANCTFVNNLSIKSIPTSAAGLPAGSVWNNGGVLNIV